MQRQRSRTTSTSLKELLFAPIGCLLTASPYAILGVIAILTLLGAILYSNFNVDLLGLGAPDFKAWTIDARFEHIQSGEKSWTIRYESYQEADFSGLVRHISPIREGNFPFLTHDILVASGEFADPEKVNTSVINHHFSWYSKDLPHPQGKLNLLHTVPLNEEIYRQLLSIQNGTKVSIRGREILKIDEVNGEGKPVYWWEDSGCNSLLVTDVEIQK